MHHTGVSQQQDEVRTREKDSNIWQIWTMEREVWNKLREWSQKITEGIREEINRNCRCQEVNKLKSKTRYFESEQIKSKAMQSMVVQITWIWHIWPCDIKHVGLNLTNRFLVFSCTYSYNHSRWKLLPASVLIFWVSDKRPFIGQLFVKHAPYARP